MNAPGGLLHAGLQSVLDTALDAVVVMDVDGRVCGWNDRATALFGWSADEAHRQNLTQMIVPHAFREAHDRGLAHFLATGEGPVLNRRIEVTAINRIGEEFPIELSVAPSDQFGDLLFIGFMRDISERRAEADRQRRILQESEHRVKNMLTIVAAIAQQTAKSSDDIDTFQKSFAGRLESLARAHELLVGKVWHDVSLTALAERVLGDEVAAGRAGFGGPEVLLDPGKVLGLSMILHELFTNAVKYGALCNDEGRLRLEWATEGNEVILTWAEEGPPCVSDMPSSGFGHRMIAMSVKADLKGTIDRDWRPDGLTAVIRFPADA
jgi:PAS domain S-box-containing protein